MGGEIPQSYQVKTRPSRAGPRAGSVSSPSSSGLVRAGGRGAASPAPSAAGARGRRSDPTSGSRAAGLHPPPSPAAASPASRPRRGATPRRAHTHTDPGRRHRPPGPKRGRLPPSAGPVFPAGRPAGRALTAVSGAPAQRGGGRLGPGRRRRRRRRCRRRRVREVRLGESGVGARPRRRWRSLLRGSGGRLADRGARRRRRGAGLRGNGGGGRTGAGTAAAAAHRLPDEAVVDGEDDGGQRDGENVGQHGGQAHPLLVGLGRHARLLVPGVSGGFTPLRPRLLLLHGGPALGPLLHRPLRGGARPGSAPPARSLASGHAAATRGPRCSGSSAERGRGGGA